MQGEEIAEESPILIRYTASCRKEGLAKASELRAQGHTVITSIIPDSANIRDEGVPVVSGSLLNRGYQEIITLR